MKIVVIGGSGLIGSDVVNRLRKGGHDVIAASPNSGVNTITGEGLSQALSGAEIVVDVANSPSFEDKAVLEFFETSGRNLFAAEAAAGVRHHIALSVVGAERNPDSGYLRAKLAQERLIKTSGIPYTILRATQFFEFVAAIIQSGADGDSFRLSPALFQPIAADDVAAALADLVVGAPLNGTVEVAGPEPITLDAIARQYLAAKGDTRLVIADVHARYFGGELNDKSLTPGDRPRLGSIRFADWLKASAAKEKRSEQFVGSH
ncbi:SDR family oxidoreductase [Methylocella silvestris]|uniref:NmrA family transcriptional regulator n=1 Tax=Methylocella silvestris TaxID=199596 RepID=A0A2J7TJY5_METSI|nr:SDR family oxidoreductase [Methylocella silvestris]PNG27073.1 NmrA family transcriptional regulator [Methylocella silvestris]